MPLSIKSPEASQLAHQLAELTGESITEAVTNALRERLSRERQRTGSDRRLNEIVRIQDRYQSLPLRDPRAAEEILGYDEAGLPLGPDADPNSRE